MVTIPCSLGLGGTTSLEGLGDWDTEPHGTGGSWHRARVPSGDQGSTKPGQQQWRFAGRTKSCWHRTVAGGTPSPNCTRVPACLLRAADSGCCLLPGQAVGTQTSARSKGKFSFNLTGRLAGRGVFNAKKLENHLICIGQTA